LVLGFAANNREQRHRNDVLDRYGRGSNVSKFKIELLLPLQTASQPAPRDASIFDELFGRLGETDADDAI
jgi:hypothetical protein